MEKKLYSAEFYTDIKKTKKKKVYIVGVTFGEAERKCNRLYFKNHALLESKELIKIELVGKTENNTLVL